jgi:uncharacterized protein (TIGR02453 family)
MILWRLFIRKFLKFDESVAGLNPRKLSFRIYRDVRFSKDKRPYKTNMGAGMSAHGKMEQEPGYYIHIEPGKSFIAGVVSICLCPRILLKSDRRLITTQKTF